MSNETNNNEYLLKVDHLKQYFPVHDGFKKMELKAVDDVSFAIKPGETLGLVGESGCGKTTVGRTLLRLYQPTAGRIEFDGNVLFDSEKKIDVNMHPYRKQMQMVFQDPYSSLNPRVTVEDIIGEPLDVHKLYNSKKERLPAWMSPSCSGAMTCAAGSSAKRASTSSPSRPTPSRVRIRS